MALDSQSVIAAYDAPKKDLYEIGEMPPLGHVPRQRPLGSRSARLTATSSLTTSPDPTPQALSGLWATR